MQTILKHAAVSGFIVVLAGSYPAYAGSAGQYLDDATVTAKVKAALMSDSQLKSTHISVETDRGNVQLSGTVDTSDQEAEAIKAANMVKGVSAVKDLMVVKGTQTDDQTR